MDLRQRLKILLLEKGLRKKVMGIVIEVDRSLKLETSLASDARKMGTLVINGRIRIGRLHIRKERNR